MYGAVVVQVVAELVGEGGEETGFDEGFWTDVDACLALGKLLETVQDMRTPTGAGKMRLQPRDVGWKKTYLSTREVDGDNAELRRLGEKLWLNHACGSHDCGFERC